jgi:RNAse (barnase) inhibitor barstar
MIEVLSDPALLSTDGGLQVVKIDVSRVDSKSALLNAIAAGMKFPGYCGSNWDALEECLRDLKEDERGWLVIFENADSLSSFPKPELATLLAVLADTSAFWKNEGRLFRTVFIGSSALAAAVGEGGENRPS